MAASAVGALTDEEIRRFLAAPKTLASDIVWSNTPTGSAYWTFADQLLDGDGKTIVGLTVKFEFRTPVIADHCKLKYTMYYFRPGLGLRRVYQIEVTPRTHKSHSGPEGTFFGPHQHHGERASLIHGADQLGCSDKERWFKLFLDNAHIQFDMRYFMPSPTGLFG